jgi:hypothetical protein
MNNSTTRFHVLVAAVVLGLGFSSLDAQTRDYSFTFAAPVAVATDTASWNYSNSASYSSGTVSATPSPTLLVRGQSSASDHAIVTTAGFTGYNVRTANLGQADFGYYIMNMDFSDLVSGEDVQVDFSFKILGNDTNSSINPANWTVKYTTAATTAGVASFTSTAATFSFVDDNSTWTTVSGSFIIPSGTGSAARGGILINAGTSGSGSTSTGSITVADIQVAVSSTIPEPSSFALLGGAAVLGCVIARRRRR